MKPTNKIIEQEIWHLMDSFLTESTDQNGNLRSIERLNMDRQLFMKNIMQVILRVQESVIEEVETKINKLFNERERWDDLITREDIINELKKK